LSFIELIGDQDNETKTIFTNFLLLLDGRVVGQDTTTRPSNKRRKFVKIVLVSLS
jgi:hypothetical protein